MTTTNEFTKSKPSNFLWSVEHTPVTERHGGDIPAYRVLDAANNAVCDLSRETPENVQALQATLIAAAPELYDALEYFFNIMHDYESSRRKGYIRVAFDKARTALTKANSDF